MFHWVIGAPTGDVAAHLILAFARGQSLGIVDLFGWLGFPPNIWSGLQPYGSLEAPIAEAVQLLEHAELVYLSYVADSNVRRWSATRFGLATLARGKEAVRQRIVDRTGL